MQITRYLKPEFVQMGMRHGHLDGIDPEKDRARELSRLKEDVVTELAELFQKTGVVRNGTKFRLDLLNREKQGTTAVGGGIAVPHVRSMQPREFAVVVARSREGVWYDAPDGEVVHVFFGLTAPSYDERLFLSFYKWIAQSFLQEDWLLPSILAAEDEHEIIGILSSLG